MKSEKALWTTPAMYPGPAQCLLRSDEAFVSPHSMAA